MPPITLTHYFKLVGLVVEGTEETSYRYDEVGNLIETIFPNGTVETREYDELYRLTNVRVVDSEDTLLSGLKQEK